MSLLDAASLVITPNGYKEGTLYSVIPNTTLGDMTVVRATTATRVNSAGLIELVPYNLLQYSEQFNNGVWGLYSSGTGVNPIVTANTTTAPNGTITADTIVLNAGAGTTISDQSEIYQIFQIATGVTYTFSFYAKGLVGGEQVMVRQANGILYTKFTLTNDWARYTVTETANGTGNSSISIVIRRSLNEPINASATFYIWGAQLVEGSVAKDYLRTETRLNVPRLDYSNGTCPSLLVEPQRTNFYPYSQQLNQWVTIAGAIVTENDAISPDGTTNADLVHFSGTGSAICNFGTGSAGTNILSVYAKAKIGTAQKFRFFANGATLFSSDFTATNQWQRFEFSYTYLSQNAGLIEPSTGVSDVLFWGFQHEIGSYPTSYIPTTSAAVTRNADVISKTGISSLIGQTEGTVFLDYIWNNNASDVIPIGINGNNGKFFWFRSNGVQFYGNSGSLIFNYSPANGIYGNRYKLAFVYGQSDFRVYENGILVASQASGTFSGTFDSILFNPFGTSPYNGSTKHNIITLFPTKLTGAECISLTTL